MRAKIKSTNRSRQFPAVPGGPRGLTRVAPGFSGPAVFVHQAAQHATPLQVRPDNDSYEHEADRIAGRIVDEMNSPCASCLPAEKVTPVKLIADNPIADCGSAEPSKLLAESQGDPLPMPMRRAAERVLGSDLTAVKVHYGPDARRLTAALGADAVASSNHVYLANASNAKPPDQAELLAHEVVHTVQQRGLTPATPLAQRGFFDRFKRKRREPGRNSQEDQHLLVEERKYPSLDEVLAEHGADRQTQAVTLNAKYRAAVMKHDEERRLAAGPPELSEDSKDHIRGLPVSLARVQGESGLTGMVDLENNTAHAKQYLAVPGRGAAHQQQAVEYHGLRAATTEDMNALKKPDDFVGPVSSSQFPFENKAGFSVGHRSEDGLHVRFGGNTFNVPSFGDHLLPRAERINVMRSLAQSGEPVRYGYGGAEAETMLKQHITRDEAELTAALVGQESVLPKGVGADRLKPPQTVSTLPENVAQIAAGIRAQKGRKRRR